MQDFLEADLMDEIGKPPLDLIISVVGTSVVGL